MISVVCGYLAVVRGQNVAALALGGGLLVFGIAPIAWRTQVADWNNRSLAKWYGRGWKRADGATPGQRMTGPMVVCLALMLVAMGAALIALSLTVNMAGPDPIPGWAWRVIGGGFALPFVGGYVYFRKRDKRSGSR